RRPQARTLPPDRPPLSLHDALPISAPSLEAQSSTPRSKDQGGAREGVDAREGPGAFGEGARGARGRSGDRAHRVDRMTAPSRIRSEEHTSELQSLRHVVCRLLVEKK